MRDTLLTVLYAVAVFFLIITFSISLPIYCRPFYYLQIESLGVCEATKLDVQTIREAYDDVLDYLTIPGKPFATGEFKHSEDGAAHFADCKVLFDLNAAVLLISAATVALLLWLHKRKAVRLHRPFGMDASALSAGVLLVLFGVFGLLMALDFDAMFVWFHRVLFPGKDNWQFNIRKDPIVKILPEAFFLRCGLLIVAVLLSVCVTLLVVQLVRRKRAARA